MLALFVGAGVVAFSGDEAPEVLTVGVGEAPFGLAADDDVLWVGNAGDLTVERLDLADGSTVGQPIDVPVRPAAIAVGEQVWVGSIEGSDVARIDPADVDAPPVAVVAGQDPAALALEGHEVWVAALNEGSIIKLSAEGEVLEEIDDLAFPSALAFVGDDLWVADVTEGRVGRIDTDTAEVVDTAEVGAGPTALASDGERLWVALFRDEALAVVTSDGGVETVELAAAPAGVAVGAGYVWATLAEDDALVRIDPATLEVSEPVEVGENPQGVVVAGGAVWVANQGDGTVTRLALPDD